METAALRNSVPPGRAGPFFGFVWAIVALAALLCARPLASLPDQLPGLPAAFWTMAVLAALGDARPFTPPGRRQSPAVFPSVCFTFAILLAWGLGPAVAVQAAAVIVSSWRMRHAPWRAAFNMAQYACALAAAAAVTRLAGETAFRVGAHLHWTDVLATAAAAGAWFVVTYGSVSLAVRLRFGGSWWPAVRHGLAFELLSTGSLLLLSPVLVAASRASAALIPLVLVPLFAVYRMSRLSAEQEQLARLDPLTGLANRKALLTEVAEQLPLHAERAAKDDANAHLALLLLDLDRFKHVNDALGHAVGDRLLVEVGGRLSTLIRPQDVVARLGGDEFAILATQLHGAADARALADEVVAALTEPVALDGLPLDVGASIGIALYPEHGEDFATLMRHADVAMYDAKHRGDTVAVYAPESDHNSPERLGLLADLRRVLETGGPAASTAAPGLAAPGIAAPGTATTGSAATGIAATTGAATGIAATGAAAPATPESGAAAPASARADPVVGAGRPELTASVPGAAELDLAAGAERAAGGLPDPVAAAPVTVPGLPPAVASVLAMPLGAANGRPATDVRSGARTVRTIPPDAGGGGWTSPSSSTPGPAIGAGGVARGQPPETGSLDGLTRPDGLAAGGDAGEIMMYYQPQIAIETGEVVGVEALLRWRHPRRGMVDPEELIRVAEQSAVMRLLTRRVVDDVVEQLAKWSAAGIDLRAAVNVSVRDLHTGEIADQIADRLSRYRVRPAQLQLEITEGALMADPRRVLATISRLDKIGVAIALDDFGTGYSSMQHLRRLPLAEVKVDRSFVLGMAVDADDAAIVRSVIELARALNLRVVAEGVEDERTWRLLHAAGCHVAQGWFYARPMPAEDLVTWLGRYRPLKPGAVADPSGRHHRSG